MSDARDNAASTAPTDFIRDIVARDVAAGKHGGKVVTRFPPEPNGYLHIGHVKAICVNFGVAADFGGVCNLRFDDTNPMKEETEYVESMQTDIRWLGFDWGDRLYFASDYYGRLYELAEVLVRRGKAYVDDLTAEEIREYRGTLTEPGRESPHRGRTVEESLDLFRRMRAGEFPDGSKTLRARIDMASPNLNMRDPVLYRILRAHHLRTGDAWCIYPMYDFAHPLSDAIEGITHSLCSLEFENHRPLYNWVRDETRVENHPEQYEFAKLFVSFTVTSKRRLLRLVREGRVDGWDDPRMPTLSGLRRRGATPTALRSFVEGLGVAKRETLVDVSLLEFALREDLNRTSPRRMAVLDPLKLVITNYPEGTSEELTAINNPEDPAAGTRAVPFSRELWIEREDFREVPPPKYHRLSPGKEVRLRYAYIVKCTDLVKNAAGEVTEVHCTYDPATRSGEGAKRKVKGTIHWVSAPHAVEAQVRLYDRLFTVAEPLADKDVDFVEHLNPESLRIVSGARLEPSLAGAEPGSRWQFERLGYFCVDARYSKPGAPVFNRTVTLRDTWARIQRTQGAG
jgi:glutaminyl-tRNA synthetase